MAGPLPKTSDDFDVLALWLGDAPGTTIPLHALRTRRCDVWLVGPARGPRAMVLLDDRTPGEPWVFGVDAESAVQLLAGVPQWKCVSVGTDFAHAVAAALARMSGREVARYGDLYFEQREAHPVVPHPWVRAMTMADAPLLAAAERDVRPEKPEHAERLLREGVCVAAVTDGRIVAQTHSYYITPRHADIGAATTAAFRRQGLGTACGSLLCARLHAIGRIPIWSTGKDNLASQRVATKLGFQRVAERVYLRLT
jgi:predicted GNAT family acetyltransferase